MDTGKKSFDEALAYYEKGEYWCAFEKFGDALDEDDNRAYYYIGQLAYDGLITNDGDGDTGYALAVWANGMEHGDEQSASAWEEHCHECLPASEDAKEVNFPNGDHYVGELDDEGLPHGVGTMTCNEKVNLSLLGLEITPICYKGYWEHGAKSGYGCMQYAYSGGETVEYKGEWKNDAPCGKGTFATSKTSYRGEWQAGLRHGKGRYSEERSRFSTVYDGEWENDKRSGKGTKETFGNIYTCYQGEWLADKEHGHGVLTFENGNSIECEWVGGRKSGAGTLYFADGGSVRATWENDAFNPATIECTDGADSLYLFIHVHARGLDYGYTATFLLPAKEGEYTVNDAVLLSEDGTYASNKPLIIIKEVKDGKAHIVVPGKYTQDGQPVEACIARGEKFEDIYSSEATATIYGDEHDYTVENTFAVECC